VDERRRLHPAAWVVHALGALREALFPLVVAVVIGGRSVSGLAFIGVLAVGISAGVGWLRWANTRYWLDDEALHFVTGIFSPDHTSVPLARVAAVDEVQGPVQRLFGVVAVHVQTAGGAAEGEIVLHALSTQDADDLRDSLGDAGAAPDLDLPSWRLSTGALLVAAVTGPQIGVVLPIVAGAAGLLSQTVPDDETDDLLQRLPELVGGSWEVLVLALAGAVLVLSLLGALVAFGGFTVHREPHRLRLRRGILQRRAASVGIGRVHAVRIVEGVVRRPFGLCAVRLEVAGYAQEAAAAQTLIPLCRRADLPRLLGELVPELPVPASPPQRPPGRALRRYVLPPSFAFVVLAALVVAPWTGPEAPLWWTLGVAALLGALVGVVRARAAGWWLSDGVVAVRRHRVFARMTTVAIAQRLQHCAQSRSLPQRRGRLATVSLAVASGHETGVAHLDAEVAGRLFAELRAARYDAV
jgi:putative membrane protein